MLLASHENVKILYTAIHIYTKVSLTVLVLPQIIDSTEGELKEYNIFFLWMSGNQK